MRPNVIASDCTGDDERFRKMHNKWFKGPAGTFDDGLFSFNEFQNIDAAVGVMLDRFAEPMPSHVNQTAPI